jgi:transposase
VLRQYELCDDACGLISDLLPPNGMRGGQWNDHRTTLNGISWILHTGAQWRELPERYGKWKSVYDRFNRWSRDGTIDRMIDWPPYTENSVAPKRCAAAETLRPATP